MNEGEIRRLLGQNAAHTARARSQATVIRSSAQAALDDAKSRLSAIRPADAMLDEAKAADYLRLVGEVGRLSRAVNAVDG